MTNFDFLKQDSQFNSFSNAAISAERILAIDIEASVLNCRRAMEFAVKWMYSVDASLHKPYDERLVCLMDNEEFQQLVGRDIWQRMKLIRLKGNDAAHANRTIKREVAELCLENLFVFLDFVACCYSEVESVGSEVREFNRALLLADGRTLLSDFEKHKIQAAARVEEAVNLQKLMKENAELKAALTARREEQQPAYIPKPLDLSEYSTRKIYIDAMLEDAGWHEGENWLNEVEVGGMPNKSGKGRADYVLYDDTQKPLALIEAKRTCADVAQGRQQAKMYADFLEQKYGRRPVVFLTNGFDTRIIDNCYPERKVATIYSKRDLEKMFNLYSRRTRLNDVRVDKEIADRYYQEEAIKAVCDSLDRKKRRKALLVMATGSGKTRTIIALCKVLLEHMWVKNILFLADRNSLVTQAKRSFADHLGDLSVVNLCEEKGNYQAHCVFSTYQTMINCIDSVKDEQGKLFTGGHFDLVICDEAHRSIYNKYKDIFSYFDAPLIGLTATPKDEIDKNTYEIFELENGVPTYGYELAQAVKDGYLVDFLSVEARLKFIEEGIVYDELPDGEKEIYEETFRDENGEIPERIQSSKLNGWLFNEDTIKQALHLLMTEGLRIQYGERLGKTIIFAKNHAHAEKILEIFNKEYAYLNQGGQTFAVVIDNQLKESQKAIDEFSDPKRYPQVAVSVDMLDTGIDVPQILNLVFFKKVMSKAKFWQMIGRGTRTCKALIDGEDKKNFYIFDLCGNFEFFRVSTGKASANRLALQGAIFNLEFQIAYKLQALEYQTERLIAYRKKLVAHMSGKVQELNRENFAVRQHLRYVDYYCRVEGYQCLSYEDTLIVQQEITPLILPDQEDAEAVRFDALLYGIELAYLMEKKYSRARSDLIKKVTAISKIANVPEIMGKADLLNKILYTSYLDTADIADFEYIREELRNLMKYISKERKRYDTNFSDVLLSVEWHEADLENDDLKNYKAKAEHFVRENQDNFVIKKLKNNKPLTRTDVEVLEQILWSEVGTQEEYKAEYGEKPLGEFVREIVGLDMNAAKEAFSEYLTGANLDNRQIYFVNQIVEYIVHNGVMKDFEVLREAPFTDYGSVVEIFTDVSVWQGIRKVIEQINQNAAVA